jgi:hypothetical protein
LSVVVPSLGSEELLHPVLGRAFCIGTGLLIQLGRYSYVGVTEQSAFSITNPLTDFDPSSMSALLCYPQRGISS